MPYWILYPLCHYIGDELIHWIHWDWDPIGESLRINYEWNARGMTWRMLIFIYFYWEISSDQPWKLGYHIDKAWQSHTCWWRMVDILFVLRCEISVDLPFADICGKHRLNIEHLWISTFFCCTCSKTTVPVGQTPRMAAVDPRARLSDGKTHHARLPAFTIFTWVLTYVEIIWMHLNNS